MAVGLMAGGAVSLAVEDFGTELIGFGIVTGKVGRSSDFDFWFGLDDGRRSEAFGGVGRAPEVCDSSSGDSSVRMRRFEKGGEQFFIANVVALMPPEGFE